MAGSILRPGFCRLIALGLDLPDRLQGHDEPSTQAISGLSSIAKGAGPENMHAQRRAGCLCGKKVDTQVPQRELYSHKFWE
jgi:hypothetical protein